jgi:hypothetical protein
MDNLKDVKLEMLFNTLNTQNFGMYTDPISGQRTLIMKNHGESLPVGGTFPNQAVATIEKSCEDLGVRQLVLLSLNGYCPCEDCDYGYGVFIKAIAKDPGQFNDLEHIQGRGYSGKLDRIECTAGLLNEDLVYQMEDDIITQVAADTKWYADAFRAYRVVLANDGFEEVDITIAGVTTNIQLAGNVIQDADANGGYTGNTNIINATPAVNADVRAIAISDTEMIIVGRSGLIFTIADGGGQTTIHIDDRYLGFMSKQADIKITVEYDQKWAQYHQGWMYTLSDPTATTTNAVSINENGTIAVVDESIVSTAANYALWNAALTNAYLTYNNTADVWYFAGMDDLGVEMLDIRITGVGTSTIILASGTYRFSTMTNDEVFRVFALQQNMGDLAPQMRMEQPLANTPYCKFAIRVTRQGFPGQDVSETTVHTKRIDIYVPRNLVYVDHWTNGSWMDEVEAGPNRHFQELLEAWSGLTLPV